MEEIRPHIAEIGNWDKFRAPGQTKNLDTVYDYVIINVTFENETLNELSGFFPNEADGNSVNFLV